MPEGGQDTFRSGSLFLFHDGGEDVVKYEERTEPLAGKVIFSKVLKNARMQGARNSEE
jgi:hypothetical protein